MLGPLIVIVVVVLVLVIGGKLLYPPAPTYISPDRPQLHVASNAAPIYRDSRTVGHAEPGDSLWVVRAGDGTTLLYTDSTGTELLGFSPVLVRPVGQPGR